MGAQHEPGRIEIASRVCLRWQMPVPVLRVVRQVRAKPLDQFTVPRTDRAGVAQVPARGFDIDTQLRPTRAQFHPLAGEAVD